MKDRLLLLTLALLLIASSSFGSILTKDTLYKCISMGTSISLIDPTIDLRDFQTDPNPSSNFWKSIDAEILVNKYFYTPVKKGFFRFELTNVSTGGFGMPSLSKDTLVIAVNVYINAVISVEGEPAVCLGQSDKLFYADSALLKRPLVWSNGDTAFHTMMKDGNYTVRTQKEDEDKCLIFPVTIPTVKVKCSSTEIKEFEAENVFSVYPNPTSGLISIKINYSKPFGKIVVRDILGNVVRELNLAGSQENYTIDLSTLMEGCYFISDTEGKHITRVILN